MTKPTGRARGRPKTKEYVTLMARVPQDLVEQVQRYARLHRQTISELIRDGLEWRITEGDPSTVLAYDTYREGPQEFLSDRNETPLDLLLEDTGSAERESLLSDTNREVVETILSDTHGDDALPSATLEPAMEIILSYTNRDAAYLSDTNTGDVIMSDTKAVSADMMSDTNSPLAETAPPRRVGRAPGPLRQRIVALLDEHPEGLTAEGLRSALDLDQGSRIGDVLQGMRRSGAVVVRGEGRTRRYCAAPEA